MISRTIYLVCYNVFLLWCMIVMCILSQSGYSRAAHLQKRAIVTDKEQETLSPASLWPHYSMLKSSLKVKENLCIEKFGSVIAYLKQINVGYIVKKSKVLSRKQIEKFLLEAADETYLFVKQEYLMKFGYLSSNVEGAGALRTEESVKEALRNLQKFANIPITGEMDERTMELMSMPRCGVKDFDPATGSPATSYSGAIRRKRYVLHTGNPWQHKDLTWSLRTKNATSVNLAEAEWVFSKALDVWAQNSRLTFTRVDDDRADILVYFHRGEHGDLFPFDGRGQILAHAFFPGPGKGGDAHFDMDEIWITNDRDDEAEGTDLFKVAAHEFGHSLGLAHSNEEGALMSPWYQGSSKSTDYQLPEDDRKAIQSLYGRKPDRYYTTTTTTTTTTRPPHAYNPYYPYNNNPRNPYYPNYHPHNPYNPPYHPRHPTTEKPRKPMHPGKKYPYPYPKDPDKYPTKPPTKYYPSDRYPNRYPTRRTHYPTTTTTTSTTTTRRPPLRHYPDHHPKPDSCNTSFDAVAVIRREVFFFKDAYFWRIGDTGLLPGHPALITRMWPALPRNLNHVDAVYETPDNKIVFFIDRQYFVFTGNSLEHGYPRPLTDLGLPARLNKIDGATVWGHNGKTFFFSGHEYWRFDEDSKRVELDYPRNIDMWRGVGENIDAVFQWRDGKTYFFKGNGFWKFDDIHMQVETKYQKLSGPFWFGCTHNFEENHTRKQAFSANEKTNATNRLKTDYSLLLFVMLATLYQYVRSTKHTLS